MTTLLRTLGPAARRSGPGASTAVRDVVTQDTWRVPVRVGVVDSQWLVGATGSTVLLNIPARGVPVGHTIIITGGANATTPPKHISAVSDSRGNTYTVDVQEDGNSTSVSLASSRLTSALLFGDTITVTFNANVGAKWAIAVEYDGLLQSLFVDSSAFGVGTGAAPGSGVTATASAVGGAAPTQDDDLIVGAYGLQVNATFVATLDGSMLVQQGVHLSGTLRRGVYTDRLLTGGRAAGAQTAAVSFIGDTSGVGWAAVVGVYRSNPQAIVATATQTTRNVTDTGATITDGVSRRIPRVVSDTGTTVTDAVASRRVRVIEDWALQAALLFPSLSLFPSTSLFPGVTTETDTVIAVLTHPRAVADTGASITDAVATTRVHLVSDTGVSVTDSVATRRARPITDTGTTNTDLVATSRVRVVSDTGATITDSVATSRVHGVADTGTTTTDSTKITVTRPVSDTGATVSDSVVGGRGFARAVTDTATTNTDSVATIRVHLIADTGATVTDSVATRRGRFLADTGATISDSVVGGRGFSRAVSDTGATVTDSTSTLRVHFITDTGASVTDLVSRRVTRLVADTGATITDSPTATRFLHAAVSDTAATITDSLFVSAGLPPTETVGLYGYVGRVNASGLVTVNASGLVTAGTSGLVKL